MHFAETGQTVSPSSIQAAFVPGGQLKSAAIPADMSESARLAETTEGDKVRWFKRFGYSDCVTVTREMPGEGEFPIIITIDYGEGCVGKHGRERKGKIIINYTDRRFVPGAVHVITFEDFYVDGKKVEGTRIRTNISDSVEDYLKFRIELTEGKVTWEDGSFATREAVWETSRVRTPNPINDERIRTGSASGVNREGLTYTVTITKAIVWKRGCLPAKRIMIPVEGIKVKEFEDGKSISIDYGDGTCDNDVTITRDGVTETVELKKHKRNG